MVTKMKNYLTLEDNHDGADFRYDYGDKMIAQFTQDFYIKNFSPQYQDKRDESLQKKLSLILLFLLMEHQ